MSDTRVNATAMPRPPGGVIGGGVASLPLHMSEKALQAAAMSMAGWLGWALRYHAWLSVRSAAGFPDAVLLHPDGRILVVEFKNAIGKVTPTQQSWLDGFMACGVPAYVWRPVDWHDGTIERVLRGEG